MTSIMPLTGEEAQLPQGMPKLLRRISVMKQTHSAKSHRYQFVHGQDADFIAYQRKSGDGPWQTVSTWMIPRMECR
jgi:hypothetical protein